MKKVLITGLTFGGKVWIAGETFNPSEYPYQNFDRADRFEDVSPDSIVEPEVKPIEEPKTETDPLTCPYCNRLFKVKGRLESHMMQCTMNPENNLSPGVSK